MKKQQVVEALKNYLKQFSEEELGMKPDRFCSIVEEAISESGEIGATLGNEIAESDRRSKEAYDKFFGR